MADEVKKNNKGEIPSEIKQEEDDDNITNSSEPTIDEKLKTDDILLSLKENTNLLHEIIEMIQGRLEYDAVKEKAIDKLNDELHFYRDNFVYQSQKGLFIDLMLLYDSLDKMIEDITNTEALSKEILKEKLETFKEELLELLYRKDITPFDEHPEFLDFKLHKTVKTIATNDEKENNKVDKIIKCGFRWNNNILRAEEVIIKKYLNH